MRTPKYATRRGARARAGEQPAAPGREEIIFLSATTILLTLLINGLTLPSLIRALGLRGPQGQLGPRVHDLRHSFTTQ
jgi:NhaP-type Na+/H+ or K+/H+ antiporter